MNLEQLRKEVNVINECYADMTAAANKYANIDKPFLVKVGVFIIYFEFVTGAVAVILEKVVGAIFPKFNGSILLMIWCIVSIVLFAKYLLKPLQERGLFFGTQKRVDEILKEKQQETIEKLVARDNEFSLIPDDYRFPEAAMYILKMFEQGRAVNMAQALDLTDVYFHRSDIERQNAAMIEQLDVLQRDVNSLPRYYR